MSSAEGYVLPKPGIPKTLGILNIIFGVILVLYGTCAVGITLLGPSLMQMGEGFAKKAQAQATNLHNSRLKEYDERVAAAKTDEEKTTITAEKTAYEANYIPPPEVDFGGLTDIYKNPTIMGYTVAQGGTGVIIWVGILISGIGLIRLSPWGRSMALWLSGLQIVRLAILTAGSILIVQPVMTEATSKMMAKVEAQAKAQGKAQPAGPVNPFQNPDMTRLMSSLGTVSAIGYFVVSSIYPIVTLILLNGDGARAACLRRKKPESPEFLS